MNLKTDGKCLSLSKGKTKCSMCKTDLGDVSLLVNHMQIVHNKTKYPCGMCGTMFAQPTKLKQHLKIKHGIDCKKKGRGKDKGQRKSKTGPTNAFSAILIYFYDIFTKPLLN